MNKQTLPYILALGALGTACAGGQVRQEMEPYVPWKVGVTESPKGYTSVGCSPVRGSLNFANTIARLNAETDLADYLGLGEERNEIQKGRGWERFTKVRKFNTTGARVVDSQNQVMMGKPNVCIKTFKKRTTHK